MTLGLLLAVGAFGAAGSGWALGRDGTIARAGAVGGVLALLLVAVLATASPTPASLTPDAAGAVPGTLWNGALVPGGYLRLVIALWSAVSMVLALVAWLVGGLAGLRGLPPPTLAALVGGTVALAASSAQLGVVAAAATGLASIPAVLAGGRAAAAGIAAREVRIAVATGLVVLAVAAVAPVLARLVLANPDGPVSGPGSGEAAAIAFGLLAVGLVVAARAGAIPWHVRVTALTDTVEPGSLPLVLAWLPLPLAVVSVGVVVAAIVPLAPRVGSAQALIVAATLLATLAAALAAFLQDDLRHAVGYATIADLGIVVLALAALDPALWGPARTWLLTAAVTKTALAAWAAVAEDRFGTRSVPELRGWLRPAPLLGVGLVLVVLATYGLPGSAVMTARLALAGHGAGGPWDALLLVASMLTLPAYLRWLWIGIGTPTTHVDRAAPEIAGLGRLPARRLATSPAAKRGPAVLPIEQEGEASTAPGTRSGPAVARGGDPAPVSSTTDVRPGTGVGGTRARAMRRPSAVGAAAPASIAPERETTAPARRRPGPAAGADAATRAAEMVRRHRTNVLSSAVLALALLAALVAFGGLDVARAACETTPALAGVAAACP